MDRQSLYFTAAFVAGIIVTVGIQEILRSWRPSASGVHPNTDHLDPAANSKVPENSSSTTDRPSAPRIVQGIEGCIGNTPLLRIKSLSDATKCEILAKAEVLHGSLAASGPVLRTILI
jgi:cysteine synthase